MRSWRLSGCWPCVVCSRRLSILTCPPFSRYSTSSARKGERCRGAYISIREDEKKQRASAVTTARPRDPKTRDGSIYAYTSARRRAPAAAPPPPAPMSPAPPSAPQRTGARARAAEVLRCSSSRDPHCHNHSSRGGGRERAAARRRGAIFTHITLDTYGFNAATLFDSQVRSDVRAAALGSWYGFKVPRTKSL